MKGWEIYDYSGIDGLKFNDKMEIPTITSPTEVLVEVHTTAVNPIDLLMISGYGERIFNIIRWFDKVNEFPSVMGCEFCGVVKEKGSKVKADIEIGDKIWGVVMPYRPGSQAEFIVVDQNNVEEVENEFGDLGADCVIDYRKDNLNEKFANQTFDIILDAAGLRSEYATKLPWKFGQYITLNSPLMDNFDSNGIFLGSIRNIFNVAMSNFQTLYHCRGFLKYGFFKPAPQGIEYFKKLVESGKMKPVIDSVYEFSEMKEAYQKVANGHLRGKVVVKVK